MRPSIIPLPQKIKYTNGCSHITDDKDVSVCNDPSLGEGVYRLEVKNDRAVITAGSGAGEFYARQTLLQIIASTGGECDNLVCEDSPLFEYRGFLLDCARHFFDIQSIKTLIAVASHLKLNKFHWHLTDDQGWRVPVDRYPNLIETGSKRKASRFGGRDEGAPYEGHYTKEEIKEIIDYCAERFIEVIPEIEMPGHTTAVLASYPELGCTKEKVDVQITNGIFETVLCVSNEKTLEFVKNVLDEICELFPGKYIHIGGDETPRTRWKNCPRCSEKAEKLFGGDYNKLQGDFILKVCDYLKEKGKTAITWNESLKGGIVTPGSALVQRWSEKGHLTADFANSGGRIIESDFYHFYLDYPIGMTPVKKTYLYNPVIPDIKDKSSVYGVEANLWTEYIKNFDEICYRLFPRLTAFAERAWSPYDSRDYDLFRDRHEKLRNHFCSYGISIIPAEMWGMSPLSRIKDIRSFFKGTLNSGMIKSIFNSD